MPFDFSLVTSRDFLFLLAAFSVSFLVIRLAIQGNKLRIPRVGVILIILFTFLSYFLLPSASLFWGLCIAAILVALVGSLDEYLPLSPLAQLGLQIFIITILILFGWHINYVTNPIGNSSILYLAAWSFPITLLWMLLIVNAINWIDGMDGLAGGISLSAFAVLALISLLPATQDRTTFTLSLAGLGILGGFFLWNAPPAKAYLGTSGSWFVGLFLALTAMIGGGKIATTLLVLAIPVLDLGLVILARVVQGKAPWKKDTRFHIHHRLLTAGFSPRAVTAMLVLATFFLGLAAAVLQTHTKLLLFGIVACALSLFVASLQKQSV